MSIYKTKKGLVKRPNSQGKETYQERKTKYWTTLLSLNVS